MGFELRDYQKEVLREVSCAYIDGKQGVLLQMATGSGKTKTAAYIVEKYASTKRQVIWLVHREELLFQASMVFASQSIKHRLICATSSDRKIKIEQWREHGQHFVNDDSFVVVCSVQTLVRRLGKIDLDPYQIIADECHLSLNKTFRTIIGFFPNARLLGLSATPTREDGQSFHRADGGLYDEMVCGLSVDELMQAGYLCDYELYVPPIPLDTTVKKRTKGGDWDAQDLEAEFKSTVVYGSVVDHYRKYSTGKPAIGFCPTVAVAQRFTDAFKEQGFKAALLEGNTEDKARFDMLKQLASGEIDVIFSVDILIEGTDVPLATTALMLRRTKSLRIYLQSIGRVLRPHPDKQKAIILDFVGCVATHGYPDDERIWSLDGKTKRVKKNDKTQEDADVKIKTCPQCFRAHIPAPVCPACGHEYQSGAAKNIEELAGELVLVERESKQAIAQQVEQVKQVRRLEERDCKTLEDWIRLGKERKYKFPRQWAERRYRLRAMKQI